MSAGLLLKGAYFFTFQIYCDFSGYSDIARGVSELKGLGEWPLYAVAGLD